MGEISDLLWERSIGPLRIACRKYFRGATRETMGDNFPPEDLLGKRRGRLEWYWRDRYSGSLALQLLSGLVAIRTGTILHWWSWGWWVKRDYDDQLNPTSGWYRHWEGPKHYRGRYD